MKRFFAILFSMAALVSATIFMSCNSDDSSSGGYNYSVLTAPQNVTTEAINSSSIQVSWNSVNGATGYQVYYSEYSSSSYASLLSTTTSTSTTATGLKPNTKYYFWVKAIKDTTMSDYSSYAYTTTKVASSSISNSESESSGTASTKLSAPIGVIAIATSSSSIRLSWYSVSGATGYQVYYSEYSYSSSASFFDSTTSTSTTVTGLKANTKYYFWVKASNGTTISDYSSYDYATTKATSSSESDSSDSSSTTTTKLSAPTGLIAVQDSSSFIIRLSWDSVSDATGYEVYLSKFSSPSYATLIETTTATSTTITKFEANTKYYFWVKATNSTTKSNWSLYDYVITGAATTTWTPPTTYQEITDLGVENAIARNVYAGNVYWFRFYALQSPSQYKYTITFYDRDASSSFSSDVVATYYDQSGTAYASDVDVGWSGRSCSYYSSQYLYVKVECKQSGSFAIYAERTKK